MSEKCGRFAVKLVGIVEAVLETIQFWRYEAITDNRTCRQCLRYDGMRMTRREIYSRFPYLEKASVSLWYPRVHPNCRCELHFEEEQE